MYGVCSSRFIGNSFANHLFSGVDVTRDCLNNAFSSNVFRANRLNAIDYGNGNTWTGNWWDDYIGIGSYPIPGTAGSVDFSP